MSDGVNNIVEAQQRVARQYLDDGSIEEACPPLKALLYIMATGEYQGKSAHDPAIRQMFSRDYLLAFRLGIRGRLKEKQARESVLWQRNVSYLEEFLDKPGYADEAERLAIEQRLEVARERLLAVQEEDYLNSLVGTLGADPLAPPAEAV